MTNYTILLPPSEGKKKGGDETKPYRVVENLKKHNSFNSLQFDREEVYNKLREALNELSQEEVEKIFDVKGKKLQESIESILDMLNSPTLNAINRFDGVMFKSINYEKLNEDKKNRFDSSVIFIDGLFGLLRPLDLTPEYKLKIGSKFLDINLVKFWKLRLKGHFDFLFKEKIVIDILPESHRKVVSYYSNIEYFEITFMDFIGEKNKYKQAGHNSKVLKGEIINYILKFETISRNDLEKFSHSSGYEYSQELSSDKKIVYLKK